MCACAVCVCVCVWCMEEVEGKQGMVGRAPLSRCWFPIASLIYLFIKLFMCFIYLFSRQELVSNYVVVHETNKQTICREASS